MLQSAIHSPGNYQRYETENNLARLAALLSCALIEDHSPSNGNKQIALLAANLVLLQNGKVSEQDPCQVQANDAITQAHGDVATGKMEHTVLTEIYRAFMTALLSQ